MVSGHAMCPTTVAAATVAATATAVAAAVVVTFAAAIDACTMYTVAIDAVSTWAYGYAPLEICYFERLGRWQKVNLSICVYGRIEYGRCICVCRSLSHTPFRSLRHSVLPRFFSRSHFLCRCRYLSHLLCSNKSGCAWDTVRGRACEQDTLCIPASQYNIT